MVRLISMAMTGYYRTMQRPRVHQPLSMLKYDPIGTTPLLLPLPIVERHARLTQDTMQEEVENKNGRESCSQRVLDAGTGLTFTVRKQVLFLEAKRGKK
jgi:hypothetical protein